jgi:hypothetical protein
MSAPRSSAIFSARSVALSPDAGYTEKKFLAAFSSIANQRGQPLSAKAAAFKRA